MKLFKVFNDPVHGFIPIKSKTHLDIINHPYFQKLRRIRQLGLSEFVYPGAVHSRFQHVLGAMYLTGIAMDLLREKGVKISEEEYNSCQYAILLHDIGHGPFSHSLEKVILPGLEHERLSFMLMEKINTDLEGKLELAIQIFQDSYNRPFFHSLISSQLDTDRLDYIVRDSYFTGVPEGQVSLERILRLLNVVDDQLVAEEKAIYPIENFINARRLMYWQVYLHKTSIGAEALVMNTLKRAKELYQTEKPVKMTEALEFFMKKSTQFDDKENRDKILNTFSLLDDSDIWGSLKFWTNNTDPILSTLSGMLLERKLYKVSLSNEAPDAEKMLFLKNAVTDQLNIAPEHTHYFVSHGAISNEAYISGGSGIRLLMKSGKIEDIANVTDLPNIKAMSKIVIKHYQCWPKELNLKNI